MSVESSLKNNRMVVFKGKYLRAYSDSNLLTFFGVYPSRFLNFSVDEYWKGNFDDDVQISLYDDMSSCSIKFIEDFIYLIYAYRPDSREVPLYLYTNLCTRTKLFSRSSYDLSVLGVSQVPNRKPKDKVEFVSVVPEVTPQHFPIAQMMLIGSIAFNGVLLFFVLRRRRTRL